MRLHRLTTLATAATFVFVAGGAQGQEYYPVSQPYNQLFSYEELDNLVAPIALYPDPILAQVFIAATFADQIDIAARHVRVFGTDNVDYQPWDVSVRAVAHYPPLLNMLADRTDWTAALGQAYAYQSNDLMDAVQRLRQMAYSQGNLLSTSQQQVIVERQIIRIVPAQPRVIYVPVYDPGVIYYRRSIFQASIHTPYWSFGVAFPIGSWLNYDCDWLGRRVYYDGWRGNGWRSRSRPFVQIVNVYVHPRYEVVNINRTIINHNVNYINLNKNNTVHRTVNFDGYARNISRIAVAKNSGRGGGNVVVNGSQRGGGAGQGGGRGANVQQQASTRVAPQQSAPAQTQQRTASPSSRAQPVQRSTQVPTMQQRQSAPQQNGSSQATQSRGSSMGRGQPAQRTQQQSAPPVVQRQSAPQVIQRQSAPQGSAAQTQQRSASPSSRGGGRGASGAAQSSQQRQTQSYPAPATRQPAVVQQRGPQVSQQRPQQVQQRQAPVQQQQQVQQRQAPVQQQQSAQRSLPPSAKAQPRSSGSQSSAPAASRGGGGGGGGSQKSPPGQERKGGRGG